MDECKWPEGPTRKNLVARLRDAEQSGREIITVWDHDPFLFGEAAAEIGRLRAVLTNIVECYDMRSEIYTSDEQMAQNFADKARVASTLP